MGYYYDNESNYYYCNSRYYNPEWGRWISPDSVEYLNTRSINGLNLYTYCMNNPVNYYDPNGKFPILLSFIIIGAIVGATSYTVSTVFEYIRTDEWNWSWGEFFGNVIGGAVGGALLATGMNPIVVSFFTGFTSTAIGMRFENMFGIANYSDEEIFANSFINGTVSAAIAYICGFAKINQLSAGKNSLEAITKQIITKHANQTIENITISTIGKILKYLLLTNLIEEIADAIVLEVRDRFACLC